MTVIAADIGGSKSLLGYFAEAGKASYITRFDNQNARDAGDILHRYLHQHTIFHPADITLVLAIAGPVQNRRHCQMTNLPWQLDADQLQAEFGFNRVILLNDLEATAWAMPGLAVTDQVSLNQKTLQFDKPVTVISVGTGLGEALLLPDPHNGWIVVPSEAGHKSFAPFDQTSAALLQQALANDEVAISWEDWFSGSGLPRLYRAMFPVAPALDSADITRQAVSQMDSHATACITLFVQGLFAEAGNAALQYWSEGGVIFAGGVVQHLKHWFHNRSIQRTFCAKSHHQAWLASVPLALCTNAEAALHGAAAYGWHQQMRGN